MKVAQTFLSARLASLLSDGRNKLTSSRIGMSLFIVWSFWACGGDSVTTPEQPTYEGGLHEVGTMTRPRYEHTATLLQSGKVLFTGGTTEIFPAEVSFMPKGLVSAEIFDPETGISTQTGDLTASSREDRGILLPDGRVLILPWMGRFPIEMYDPHSGRFDDVAIVPWSIGTRTATLLPNGEVFLTSYLQAGVFDPTKGTFSATFAMYPTRVGHTATLLKDGRVLIVGGQIFGGDVWFIGLNLIYDPSTGAFSEAGHLQFDRLHHKAVLLEDGRVLIIGGSAGKGPFVQTAEIFDPETNTFSPAGTSAMNPMTALLLPSGRVFLIHRDNGNIALYNPDTQVISPTGHSIGPWRYRATVTLLDDGRVVIAGGLKWSDDSHYWESITDQIFIFTP